MQADQNSITSTRVHRALERFPGRVHAHWKTGLTTAIAASLMFIVFAPAAQALYLDLNGSSNPAVGSTLDIEMEGHSISISNEILYSTIGTSGIGLSLLVQFSVKTIHFNSGPVMLSSVDFDRRTTQAVVGDATGMKIASPGAVIDQLVTSIHFVEFGGPSSWGSAMGVNVDLGGAAPVNAIPEPGAAMLFAAGLTAIGASARRGR